VAGVTPFISSRKESVENMNGPPETSGHELVKTVLIIDDDQAIGEVLSQAIKDETPHQVVLAHDGFEALKLVRSLTPQLVLLDYLLPSMDGLECAEALRGSPGLEHVPILFMTASMPPSAEARSDLFLVEKPFELDAVLEQVKRLLKS
jgi:CheY-like chemotaxis protein